MPYRVRTLILAVSTFGLAGCPAQPPRTQGARTPEAFLKRLAETIPVGTKAETAIRRLMDREAIHGAKLSAGDFVTDDGSTQVHRNLKYIEFEHQIATNRREWQTVRFALILENDKVTRCLFRVIRTEPRPELQPRDRR